jgi:phosphate transport system ATP-binding protein
VYGDGVDVTAVRRLIGMVFQKPNPFPTMSIFDNVAAGLRLTGTRGGNLHERVQTSLRAVGLWDEVQEQAPEAGDRPLRWPAAAPVHRAHARDRA